MPSCHNQWWLDPFLTTGLRAGKQHPERFVFLKQVSATANKKRTVYLSSSNVLPTEQSDKIKENVDSFYIDAQAEVY